MRTAELLNALAKIDPGIECTLVSGRAAVTTLYEPLLGGEGKTLFAAAFQLAKKLTVHPQCPASITAALSEYDEHTECLI